MNSYSMVFEAELKLAEQHRKLKDQRLAQKLEVQSLWKANGGYSAMASRLNRVREMFSQAKNSQKATPEPTPA